LESSIRSATYAIDVMNSQFNPRLTRDSPAIYAINSNNLSRD